MKGLRLVFLIDENIARKEINEVLKPIKSFCKQWGMQIQYDGELVTTEIVERINRLIELLKLQDGEATQIKIKKLQ